jgi:hypothetical protein
MRRSTILWRPHGAYSFYGHFFADSFSKTGAPKIFGPNRRAALPNFFSLSRYDAALARFSRYEPCGARRFFGDPMELIRFTDTFFSTRFEKWRRKFPGPKRCAPFPNFFSLSRYDAALARFFDYELCGARRFFGDPMALICFTATFFATRSISEIHPRAYISFT